MTDEDDLRRMLGAVDSPSSTLDAKLVINRSRARRLPRQIAAGATSALVLAGVTFLGVQVTQQGGAVSTAGGAAESSQAYDTSEAAPEMDTMLKRSPADKVNLCTAPLSEVAGSQYGLQLDVVPPSEAPTGTGPVAVTVRLTNASEGRVVGTTLSLPAITLSQGGIVLWHTNGTPDQTYVQVNLAPGESLDYVTTFTPVRCEAVDDEGESFRADLPPLQPGEYALSALVDFTADASMGQETPDLDLVAGPLTTFALG